MADKQILVTGSSDAPEGYTVPNTVELIPKAVSCILDGTGASGDFVPVLEIVSDGGVVVAQSPGSTVTAGGSVEQSWFPRVGGSGGASAGLPCCFIDTTSGFTLSAWGGVYSPVTWELFNTTDSTVFSWPSGGDSTKVHIAKTGYYRFVYEYQTNGTNFPAGPGTIISTVATTVTASTNETPSVNASTGALYLGDTTAPPPWGPVSERVFRLGSAQDVSLYMAWQSAGGSATINTVVAFIYRLGG